MKVERINNEVVIRLPGNVNVDDLQDMVNYARYKELTARINVTQDDIDQLASEINKDWWSKNRDRLTK